MLERLNCVRVWILFSDHFQSTNMSIFFYRFSIVAKRSKKGSLCRPTDKAGD